MSQPWRMKAPSENQRLLSIVKSLVKLGPCSWSSICHSYGLNRLTRNSTKLTPTYDSTIHSQIRRSSGSMNEKTGQSGVHEDLSLLSLLLLLLMSSSSLLFLCIDSLWMRKSTIIVWRVHEREDWIECVHEDLLLSLSLSSSSSLLLLWLLLFLCRQSVNEKI